MRPIKISLLCAALFAANSVSAAVLADGGFETQGAGVTDACSFPSSCPAGVWTGPSGSGIRDESSSGTVTGSSLSAGPVLSPDGEKYGWVAAGTLQYVYNHGSSPGGLFTLSWLDAGTAAGPAHAYSLVVDGTPEIGGGINVGNYVVFSGQDFAERSSLPFLLTGGTNYTFNFQGLSLSGAAYIDRLALNPVAQPNAVPEPTTWALMIVGFGAVGASLRKRRRRIAKLVAA